MERIETIMGLFLNTRQYGKSMTDETKLIIFFTPPHNILAYALTVISFIDKYIYIHPPKFPLTTKFLCYHPLVF